MIIDTEYKKDNESTRKRPNRGRFEARGTMQKRAPGMQVWGSGDGGGAFKKSCGWSSLGIDIDHLWQLHSFMSCEGKKLSGSTSLPATWGHV